MVTLLFGGVSTASAVSQLAAGHQNCDLLQLYSSICYNYIVVFRGVGAGVGAWGGGAGGLQSPQYPDWGGGLFDIQSLQLENNSGPAIFPGH